MASTFGTTPVKKRNVDLHLTAVRPRRATVITVWKCNVPFQVSGMIVNMYVTGLMLLGPGEKERYGLSLRLKYEWLLAIAALYAPAS
jgi:hypothetical protein